MPVVRPQKVLCGIVVSAGKMMKAVKVRTAKQTYDRFLRKHFQSHTSHLVSDPTSALRTGDVVRIAAERKISRHIRHVVTEIVAPWGSPVEDRPVLLSGEERRRLVREKTERKKERRRVRRGEVGMVGDEGEREQENEQEKEREGESEDDRVEGVVEGTAVAS